MTTHPPSAPPVPAPSGERRYGRRLPQRLRNAELLRRLAVASVVANVVIVVTGGAVRLSDSGLGCPTWPRCTAGSLTPTRQYAIHGVIEFSNRMLTVVLVVIALATWAVAMAQRRERVLATVAVLGIPAQAVLGGLTVLTHLNPWLVAGHFLLSTAIVAVTFLLWWRLHANATRSPAPQPVRVLAAGIAAVVAATLALGTVVTGAGPHAGDKAADGTIHRNGLHVASVAQLHADIVMILIGLTVGLVLLVRAVPAEPALRRAAAVLLGIELAQGVIGYTQYFLHVPPLLVGFHMLGACLVWLAALQVLLLAAPPRPAAVPTARGAAGQNSCVNP